MTDLLREDRDLVVWWGTEIECLSALRRSERAGSLSVTEAIAAVDSLALLCESWTEVVPSDEVRDRASRALVVHGLRAADSLQLAAALIWRPVPSAESRFVSLDGRLADAARREGFRLAI
jgi:predicted nucleic acid-binding protein